MRKKFNTLRLEVTGKCNLRCKYCHAEGLLGTNVKPYDPDELLEIMDQAKALGVKEVVLIGGEPLVFPGIWKIIEKSPIPKIIITTNGTLLNSSNISRLQRNPAVKEMRISLDGLATHDEFRVPSSYQDIIKKVIAVKSKLPRMRIIIQTTCHQGNIGELPQLYKILKSIGVDKWRLSVVWDMGRAHKNSKKIIFRNFEILIKSFKALLTQYFKEPEKPFDLEVYSTYNSDVGSEPYSTFQLNDKPCSYYLDTLCVCADRTVIHCPKYREERIEMTQKLAEIVESRKYKEFGPKKIKVGDLPCKECRYLKLCGGGCRANALYFGDSLASRDPVACYFLPLVEKEIVPILPPNQAKVYWDNIDPKGKYPDKIFSDSF